MVRLSPHLQRFLPRIPASCPHESTQIVEQQRQDKISQTTLESRLRALPNLQVRAMVNFGKGVT